MTQLKIHPLGSNGWIPSNGFETVCFAFFHENELYILDAGTGLGRLLKLRDTLFAVEWSKLKHVHVFLSHYHLDHICGLFWGRAIFEGIPLTVYGPGVHAYKKSAKNTLDEVFRKPFSPKPFNELVPGVEIIDLDPPGMTLAGNRMKIDVLANPEHSDPSVSLKFNDWFAYVTDTPPKNETVDFVKGVKVLFHESYYDSYCSYKGENDDLDLHRSGPHTGTMGAGLIAKRGGVKKLVLVHHNPEFTLREVEAGAIHVREPLGIDCTIARDLDTVSVEI